MAWIDTSQPVCSFALSAAGRQDICLDLFPSRIAFAGDPDDLLGAILVACIDPVEHCSWNQHALDRPQRGFLHPCGEVGEGAFSFHSGQPLSSHGVWLLENGQIHTPDGQVFDAGAFSAGPVYDTQALQGKRRRDFDVSAPTLDKAMNVAVGAIKALDGVPVLHGIDHVHYLMDALLLAWSASRARPFGQAALKTHAESTRGISYDACNTWTLRCDRPYAPSTYVVLSDRIPDAPDSLSQAHQDAGFAAARYVLGAGVHAYHVWRAWGEGDTSYLSAHQRLAIATVWTRAVDAFRPLAAMK